MDKITKMLCIHVFTCCSKFEYLVHTRVISQGLRDPFIAIACISTILFYNKKTIIFLLHLKQGFFGRKYDELEYLISKNINIGTIYIQYSSTYEKMYYSVRHK